MPEMKIHDDHRSQLCRVEGNVIHVCGHGCCYNSSVNPCCPDTLSCTNCYKIGIYSGYASACVFAVILIVLFYCACQVYRKRKNTAEKSRRISRNSHRQKHKSSRTVQGQNRMNKDHQELATVCEAVRERDEESVYSASCTSEPPPPYEMYVHVSQNTTADPPTYDKVMEDIYVVL